jgi:hypothetical protein
MSRKRLQISISSAVSSSNPCKQVVIDERANQINGGGEMLS